MGSEIAIICSAVEPIYLDCSEVLWTRSGGPPVDWERLNYVRVFKDRRLEVLNVDWSWYDAKQTVYPDKYCATYGCIERDSLELSVTASGYEKRQCKIIS